MKKTKLKLLIFKLSFGQSLIELLLAIGLLSILLPAILTGLVASREGKPQQEQRTAATVLLKESEEAVRSIREKGWSNLTNGTYHPLISGSTWSLGAGSETVSNFTRQIVIADAQRDATGKIVDSEIPDPATKKVTTTVSWNTPILSSVTSTSFLSRYLGNTAWVQTTSAHFNAGTRVNTQVVPTGDGAVELAPVSGGSWSTPQIIASRDFSGAQDANDVFVLGNFAYVVTVSRTGADFFIYNISTPSNPTLTGSLDLASTGFAVVVAGSYAYVASSHDSRELTIINITSPTAPTIIGSYNTPATAADGRGIDIAGTNAFLVTDNNTTAPGYEFYSINVANPATPNQLGGRNLAASARDILVSGSNAFIASTSNTQELQVTNISNPAAPTANGTFNASGTTDGLSVYVVSNTAYLGAGSTLYLLNVTNLPTISQISTFGASGTVFSVFVLGNFAFVGNSQASSQFKVVNITVPTTPTLFGSANLGGNGLGLFVSGNFAYLATTADTAEFRVIEGGSGSGFQPSGTFESQTFDCYLPTAPATAICNGTKAGYNYITMAVNEPVPTNVRLQIAVNDDNATWNFVGPDGSVATYFDNTGAIPLQQANGRYFRFKATLDGNGTITPTLLDVTLNYSP